METPACHHLECSCGWGSGEPSTLHAPRGRCGLTLRLRPLCSDCMQPPRPCGGRGWGRDRAGAGTGAGAWTGSCCDRGLLGCWWPESAARPFGKGGAQQSQ